MHRADINKESKNGETPLFNKCKNKNKDLVKYLVEHGLDINIYGKTPLFYTCESGNINLEVYLVEHGADIKKKSIYGRTPLFLAIESENKENKNGETSLFLVIESENEDLKEFLVEHGADINKEERTDHETPLLNAYKEEIRN